MKYIMEAYDEDKSSLIVCEVKTGQDYMAYCLVERPPSSDQTCRMDYGPFNKILQIGTRKDGEIAPSAASFIHGQMDVLELNDTERANVGRAYKKVFGHGLPGGNALIEAWEKAVRAADAAQLKTLITQDKVPVNTLIKGQTALDIVLTAIFDEPLSTKFHAARDVLKSKGGKMASQLPRENAVAPAPV